MVTPSPSTILGSLTVVFSYFLLKHQTLKSTGELQEEIENRLQPKYSIAEPVNTAVLPHTDWPTEEFYFEVWHVEVHESDWMNWKKWLPRGSIQGRTIVHYEIHGHDAPPQEELHSHHLYLQPYVQTLERDRHDPTKIKVIYESVDPSNISLFVKQFRYLIRDTTFYHLNPDVDPQYEFIRDDEGKLYGRIFDANKSEPIGDGE